jgi:hypothetical protein
LLKNKKEFPMELEITLNIDGAKKKFQKKSISRLPVVPYTLGIITQNWETSAWDKDSQVVQACPLMDYPSGTLKGHTYLVSDAWVLYGKKIMTERAWKWWIQTDVRNYLMINRGSKWNNDGNTDEPAFEDICLPNNFIAMDSFTTTHARIVGRHSLNFNVGILDPKKDNWFYRPWQFMMATTQKNKPPHEVGRIADGSYFVYTPVMGSRDQWIQNSRVEFFPKLPMNVTYENKTYTITGYCLKGASVYGHAEETDVPLRLVRYIGEWSEPCPEWHLSTRPVPPEVRPEWK